MSATMTFTCETPEALCSEIKSWAAFLTGGIRAAAPEQTQFPPPATQAAATPPPATPPTTPAPAYTLDQITRAGADLVSARPDLMGALMAMLPKYSVQTLAQLQPEHFGAVATELRALGAGI